MGGPLSAPATTPPVAAGANCPHRDAVFDAFRLRLSPQGLTGQQHDPRVVQRWDVVTLRPGSDPLVALSVRSIRRPGRRSYPAA